MRRWAGTAIMMALVAGMTAGAAGAKTYKPTRVDDPAPGKCKQNDCSLREAISAANKRDGLDKVLIPAGKYVIERPDDGTDDNDDGDFDVTDEVLIKGAGPTRTRIDGQGFHRVFAFLGFPAHALKGVTVRGGSSPEGGGGVLTGPSPLTLADVVIKKNAAASDGAGLRSVSPELKLRRVTVANNEAGDDGGGIFLGVSVADVEASIVASTISGNLAGGDGGGVTADGTDTVGDPNSHQVEIENSTVADNKADGAGGGATAVAGTVMTIDNATVARNVAEADGAGGSDGGGIFSSASAFSAFESVIAHNGVQTTGSDPQCSGAFLGSGNVLSTPTGCSAFSQGPDQLVADALIGTLADEGGPTKTIRLRAGSPAIGFADDCPARDQRGKPRPDTGCDSGAYERKGP